MPYIFRLLIYVLALKLIYWVTAISKFDLLFDLMTSSVTSSTPKSIQIFPQKGYIFIPLPNEVGGGGGGYIGSTLSVRPSDRPSVCRRHGFRSIVKFAFYSIWNFICILMVVIGSSLLIFSDITFKMAAWRPYWIFLFPDSNLGLALNINSKLQPHNTYVFG